MTKNKIKIMDMKNTTILLIFLLCILGLMVGVCYTESSEPAKSQKEYNEIIKEDSNGTITINLEKKDNEKNFINRILT